MNIITRPSFLVVLVAFALTCTGTFADSISPDQLKNKYDICIYGGTSAGVMAASSAARRGASVLVIEPKKHLGGLSSGGLGLTDVDAKDSVRGLALDFYRRLGQHYGTFTQWHFEPHVGERVFDQYMKESGADLLQEFRIAAAVKKGTVIESITVEHIKNRATLKIQAAMFIDASYEGDLMARAGVSYAVGRESNDKYGETLNGIQYHPRHQFPDGVSPYVVDGDPESGLLSGINATPLPASGTGDDKVQAYNFRVCLSNQPGNQIPIVKPADYDPATYELLARTFKEDKKSSLRRHLIIHFMPGNKTDINSAGGFSTDAVGQNWNYPDASYEERKIISESHESYTRGLLYFLGHDERVPSAIRVEMLTFGYPKDEYVDNGGFTHELYIREARRMIGSHVMTEDHCMGRGEVDDGVVLGAYNLDSHHCQRFVINGMVKNEGEVSERIPATYPISYGSIVPKPEECTNLLVPVCVSASHIAFGSIRMEPVFMGLGHAAGVAASLALESEVSVQDVSVPKLQHSLRTDPYLDGRPADVVTTLDETPKRIHTTGNWQLKVENRWSAQLKYLYFDPDTAGGGENSVTFRPLIRKSGNYTVGFECNRDAGLISRPATIHIQSGTESHTVAFNPAEDNTDLNRRMKTLGTFAFHPLQDCHIRLTGSKDGIPLVASRVILKWHSATN